MGNRLKQLLTQIFAGVLFGLGLAIAGMTSPLKVLAFLDFAGQWNPSLLIVLGTAVLVAGYAFRVAQVWPKPILKDSFPVLRNRQVDFPLIVGSAVFGIGWGIAGYCPGPAVALLAVPRNPEAWTVLTGMALGYLCEGLLRQSLKKTISPLNTDDN